jgi:hypothetical protein
MSRGRFGLLLTVLVLVLGAASFVGVYTQLDDGPGSPSGSGDTSSTTLAPAVTTTTTTVPGGLATPTFVVVVSSESDEGAAQVIRDELTESGYDSGVLHSDDFTSLESGFWVAYVGPFPQVADANAAQAALVADGYTASYARCVGTAEDC